MLAETVDFFGIRGSLCIMAFDLNPGQYPRRETFVPPSHCIDRGGIPSHRLRLQNLLGKEFKDAFRGRLGWRDFQTRTMGYGDIAWCAQKTRVYYIMIRPEQPQLSVSLFRLASSFAIRLGALPLISSLGTCLMWWHGTARSSLRRSTNTFSTCSGFRIPFFLFPACHV